ncbi:sodium-dependent phosphate transport protein 2A [Elysia marginata]|uniref:Sodium-dependent phosphate transport protein 2A n=1 Tax=Elysia marginata TaxID=1093978 RepID=A0AAV4FGU7_9GAST|nr:sodium-dependent phosphate transport protein 2A [Elysia marginata]
MLPQEDNLPKTETAELDNDEGCFIDIDEEARGLSAGPAVPSHPKNAEEETLALSAGLLVRSTHGHKDSGFSSRVSEVGEETEEWLAAKQALQDKKLARRLTRISECQNEEACRCSWSVLLKIFLKILLALALLYTFICLLDLLGNAFRLLGGKTAGSVFQDSELLANPITGLMIGVLATVILQSSSTSSSIVITMVASKILDLRPAIPIIMGANIGTTVTNTLVSLAHSMQRKEFRRAFSGAVIHDVFNWLTVLILLPLEHMTGYLYHLTGLIIRSLNMEGLKANKQDLLKKLTKPLTSRIVQVDKKVITGIAQGHEEYKNKSLLKVYCTYDKVTSFRLVNESSIDNETGLETWSMVNSSVVTKIPLDKCENLFAKLSWSDTTSGIVLLLASILCISLCLYSLVKLLHSLLGGHIARALRKTINSDFPQPFSCLTGYAAIIVGAGMTILVQSSSVFTSALTPLVGIGCLKLERMYPLTLGSNIGTTFTGILAALASSSSTMHIALQLAFCHLFFNISGILIFYPVPKMRHIIINTAKYLGRTTARYRWFAIAYLIFMFIMFPGFFFVLSLAGRTAFIVVLCIIGAIAFFIVIVTLMQRSKKFSNFLPEILRTWKFLPEFMRSLAPMDRGLNSLGGLVSRCCCLQCCKDRCSCLAPLSDEDMGSIDLDSDIDDSFEVSNLSSAVSSKVHLAKSSSQPSFTESRRIYRPANDVSASPSRRSSIGRKSPSTRRAAYTDAAANGAAADSSHLPLMASSESSPPKSGQKASNGILKPSFYISKSDDHYLKYSLDAPLDGTNNIMVVNVAPANLDVINESKI